MRTRNIIQLDGHQTHHMKQDGQLKATSHYSCVVLWFKIDIY